MALTPQLSLSASTSTTQTTSFNQQGANVNTGISFGDSTPPTNPVVVLAPGAPGVSTFSFEQWTQSGVGMYAMYTAIVIGVLVVLAGIVKWIKGSR